MFHRFFSILTALVLCLTAAAETVYTRTIADGLASLQVRSTSAHCVYYPVIELGSDEVITVAFDELSQDGHNYSYTVIHCNRNWEPDDLFTTDYLKGYTSADITDYLPSINSSVLYTHYQFQLPNDDMSFLVSGNYAVLVYEDGNRDEPVLTVRFSIVEPMVKIEATVTPNTDREIARRYQQVELAVDLSEAPVRTPQQEVAVLVQQNQRLDNQVWLTRANFQQGSKLLYQHNQQLIFEGGNEFRRFDINSRFLAGTGVNRIRFDQACDDCSEKLYHAWLEPLDIKARKNYETDYDVDGRYVIHAEKVEDSDIEAEYMLVHIGMPGLPERLDTRYFLVGEAFNHYLLTPANELHFDRQHNLYCADFLLKQGGYNYQVLAVPTTSLKRDALLASDGSLLDTDGSHWQTQNQYAAFVYSRCSTDRYDRLIGWVVF